MTSRTRSNRLGRRDPVAGERAGAADAGERLVALAAQSLGEQRVVAELRMAVERQVVAGQRNVVLEQRSQPLGEHRRQARRVEVPEQPVVHEHELRLLGHRALDQLA